MGDLSDWIRKEVAIADCNCDTPNTQPAAPVAVVKIPAHPATLAQKKVEVQGTFCHKDYCHAPDAL